MQTTTTATQSMIYGRHTHEFDLTTEQVIADYLAGDRPMSRGEVNDHNNSLVQFEDMGISRSALAALAI